MKNLELSTPIVSVEWLADHINDPNLIVLDATIAKVTQPKNDIAEVQIPGARFFDIKKVFSDLTSGVPNMLATPEQFEKGCSALGITNTHTLIIYDRLGIYSSPRAWWMFMTMGFTNVAVLDGGLPAWIQAGLPTEKLSASSSDPNGSFQSKYKENLVCNLQDVQAAMNATDTLILDARSAGRFNATAPEPRADLRGGHIPGSKSLPYTQVLSNNHFLPKAELKIIFDKLDVRHKKLIFTCGSGITACIILLAAHISGHENLSVYDGSWSEWGLPNGLPIAQ